MSEPDPVERRRGRLATSPGRHAAIEQAVGDVVERGLATEQVELLEDEADPPCAQRGQPPVGHARHVVPGDPDGPLGRPVERAEEVQERRLARAGRADDRDELAALDPEVDRLEGVDRRHARVALADPGQLGDGAHDGTTTASPAAMPVPRTSTQASWKMPRSTRTSLVVPSGASRSTA